jgi:hypothetical protein
MKAMGFHASSWALTEHPLVLGMEADNFMYREEESFLFNELERFICWKYVFLFQVVFFNFGSLIYTPCSSYRYNGLAVELIVLGKPVLSYIREDDLKFMPPEMAEDLPIINTCPENLKQNLIFLIEMPYEELVELGRKSRQYVEKWYCPKKVVGHLIEEMNLC